MVRLLFLFLALAFSNNANPHGSPETFTAAKRPEAKNSDSNGSRLPSHFDLNTKTYNIWEYNCHSAANMGALVFENAGILVCGGDPKNSIGHHTANYQITSDGNVCIWNWGHSCCWKSKTEKPDIGSGSGQVCAKKACDKQYGGGTRLMKPGELVEIPSIRSCAKEQLDRGILFQSRDACLSCCDSRADHWAPEKDYEIQFKQDYIRGCKRSCNTILGEANGARIGGENDTLGIRVGKKCSSSTWTKTGCRECCNEAYVNKQFPTKQIRSCYALCN